MGKFYTGQPGIYGIGDALVPEISEQFEIEGEPNPTAAIRTPGGAFRGSRTNVTACRPEDAQALSCCGLLVDAGGRKRLETLAPDFYYFVPLEDGTFAAGVKLPEVIYDGNGPIPCRVNHNKLMKGIAAQFFDESGEYDFGRAAHFWMEFQVYFDQCYYMDNPRVLKDRSRWLCDQLGIRDEDRTFERYLNVLFSPAESHFALAPFDSYFRKLDFIHYRDHMDGRTEEEPLFKGISEEFFVAQKTAAEGTFESLREIARIDPETFMPAIVGTDCEYSKRFLCYIWGNSRIMGDAFKKKKGANFLTKSSAEDGYQQAWATLMRYSGPEYSILNTAEKKRWQLLIERQLERLGEVPEAGERGANDEGEPESAHEDSLEGDSERERRRARLSQELEAVRRVDTADMKWEKHFAAVLGGSLSVREQMIREQEQRIEDAWTERKKNLCKRNLQLLNDIFDELEEQEATLCLETSGMLGYGFVRLQKEERIHLVEAQIASLGEKDKEKRELFREIQRRIFCSEEPCVLTAEAFAEEGGNAFTDTMMTARVACGVYTSLADYRAYYFYDVVSNAGRADEISKEYITFMRNQNMCVTDFWEELHRVMPPDRPPLSEEEAENVRAAAENLGCEAGWELTRAYRRLKENAAEYGALPQFTVRAREGDIREEIARAQGRREQLTTDIARLERERDEAMSAERMSAEQVTGERVSTRSELGIDRREKPSDKSREEGMTPPRPGTGAVAELRERRARAELRVRGARAELSELRALEQRIRNGNYYESLAVAVGGYLEREAAGLRQWIQNFERERGLRVTVSPEQMAVASERPEDSRRMTLSTLSAVGIEAMEPGKKTETERRKERRTADQRERKGTEETPPVQKH